jgi:hypothetical protein
MADLTYYAECTSRVSDAFAGRHLRIINADAGKHLTLSRIENPMRGDPITGLADLSTREVPAESCGRIPFSCFDRVLLIYKHPNGI